MYLELTNRPSNMDQPVSLYNLYKTEAFCLIRSTQPLENTAFYNKYSILEETTFIIVIVFVSLTLDFLFW